MRSFKEYWDEHGDVYAMEVAEKVWDYQQSKVDELQLKLSEDSRILHNVIDIERKKNDELQKRVDDLTELNRLKTIALQQSVNRTSLYVHEKIVALEQALKGGGE